MRASRLRIIVPLTLALVIVACQNAASPRVTPTPIQSTPAAAAATSTAETATTEPSATTSFAPATAFDPSVLEATLTTAGCEFSETASGPHQRAWLCNDASGGQIVMLLPDPSGKISDVMLNPGSDSNSPSDEATQMLSTILTAVAPNAASSQVDDAVQALKDYDPTADPVKIRVAGWTVFLAANGGASGDNWSVGIGPTK